MPEMLNLDEPTIDRAALRRLALALTHNEADADDLAHDTWLAVRADPRASQPRWLSRVGLNLMGMRRRRERRRQRREAEYSTQRPASAQDGATEATLALDTAMAALQPHDRALLIARYVEGYSAVEIGVRESLPASTIRTRLARAKTRLRDALDEQWRPGWRAWAVSLGIPLGPGRANVAAPGMVVLASFSVGLACAGLAVSNDCAPPSAPAVVADGGSNSAEQPVNPDPAPVLARTNPSPQRTKVLAARRERERIRAAAMSRAAVSRAAMPQHGEEDRETSFSRLPGDTLNEPIEVIAHDCAELLPSGTTGKFSIRAHLIGEPDVGTVVDTVEVTEDTIGHPEFAECWIQSVFAVQFEPPQLALIDQHFFTYNATDGSVTQEVPLDPARILEYLTIYPELEAGIDEMLEADASDDPDLRDAQQQMRAALAEDE